jgi:hypothetical protein
MLLDKEHPGRSFTYTDGEELPAVELTATATGGRRHAEKMSSPVKKHPSRQSARRSSARRPDASRSAAEKALSFSLLATTAGHRKGESRSTAEPTAPTRNTQHTSEAAPTPLPAATAGRRMLSYLHEQAERSNQVVRRFNVVQLIDCFIVSFIKYGYRRQYDVTSIHGRGSQCRAPPTKRSM